MYLGAVQSSLRHGKEWMVFLRSLFSLFTRSCSMERSCSTCSDRDRTWFCKVSMVPVNLVQKGGEGKIIREGAEEGVQGEVHGGLTHVWIFCCEALLSSTSVWLVLSSSLAVPSSCSYTLACCSFISRRTSSCFERYCGGNERKFKS